MNIRIVSITFIYYALILILLINAEVLAQSIGGQSQEKQHKEHAQNRTKQPSQPKQDEPTDHDAMQHNDTNSGMSLLSMPGMGTVAGIFGSGTSIQPMSVAEPMLHKRLGNWTLMFHANVFILGTQQTGPRGHDKFFSANWFMPMLVRQAGRHTFTFRTMLSLEPATVTKRRYPELFQTGETAFGLPIVDGQHPHDLLMELAGMYTFQAGERTQLFIYGGPVGEPAIGPTAYPHRLSASENPLAVLAHHQQDSTHISNSVITLGFAHRWLQLEASTFRGREPNENRWNIDGGRPDSFASRITLSPTRNLTGQFSIGRINNREELEPEVDTFRMTASLHYNRPISRGHWASSIIWGRNKDLDVHPRIFNSYTLESTLKFLDKNWIWGRIENVDRDRRLLIGEALEALEVEETPIGRVQAYTLGYERELPQTVSWLNTGIGFQFTIYNPSEQLKPTHGKRPAGFQLFLRLRPQGSAQHTHQTIQPSQTRDKQKHNGGHKRK